MKLLRVRVEQFQRFVQAVEVKQLGAGLNLFVGRNEIGKSTLVRAIRYAFFERHGSTALKEILPWQESSGASPEVQVDFELNGELWELKKSFFKRARCELRRGAQRWDGQEAEELLAATFGFSLVGRGASRAEHWGIPGLLWVEQGSGQELEASATHAANQLQGVLNQAMGEVTSSAGDELLREIEAELEQWETATGRPRGKYQELIKQREELGSQLIVLERALQDYRSDVDRLSQLMAEDERDAAEEPWLKLRQEIISVEAKLAEVQKQRLHKAQLEQQLEGARGNYTLQLALLKEFAEQQSQLAERERAFQQAHEAQLNLVQQQPALLARLAEARAVEARARGQLVKVQEQARRDELSRELSREREGRAEGAARLERAKALQKEWLELSQQRGGAAPGIHELKRLKELDAELRELQVRRSGVAARIDYELLPEQRLQLGDVFLEGRGTHQLLGATELHLPGLGQIKIIPGGEADLQGLARREEAARAEFERLLGQLEVMSLAEAEERSLKRARLEHELQATEKALAALAPKGIEALIFVDEQGAERTLRLEQRLRELPEPPEGQLPSFALAQAEHQQAELVLTQLAEQLKRHEAELAGLLHDEKSALTELERLRALLGSDERKQQKRQAEERSVQLRAEEAVIRQSLEAAERALGKEPEGLLEQDLARLSRSAKELEDRFSQRKMDLLSLRSRLEAQGAAGLEERQAELRDELSRVTSHEAQLARQVEALRRVKALLLEKKQELTQRLQAPLQARLRHYLRILIPEAELTLDEQLKPTGLRRAGEGRGLVEEFGRLSFGVREQLGLISRLAYADLLKDAGRPTLIILDDALVHTDEQRLASMKRVLYDAGQRHQVLLFTCHPEKWLDLGVSPIDLAGILV